MPDADTTTDATATDTDATATDTTTDQTTTDDTGSKNLAAELDKWKAMARKHESASKANADKAKQFDAFEESQKTEQQKLADAKAAAEADAATTRAELAVLQAAVKHKLASDDLELLGTHGTPDEIDARAEKLAARLKAAEVKPDFGGGSRGSDVGAGVQQLSPDDVKKLYAEKRYDEIEKARVEGRLATVLGN
jgi:hypothetical protein